MTDVPLPDNRRPALAPILIGGVVAIAVLALRSPIAAWIKGFLSPREEPADLTGNSLLDRDLSPSALRRAILGKGKTAVAAACGAPRTAAGGSAGSSGKVVIGGARGGRAPNFWNADTWYYPLDSRTQTAMAVRFENGIARQIEFFAAPKSS